MKRYTLVKTLLAWWKRRRLRIASEQHAKYKALAECLKEQRYYYSPEIAAAEGEAARYAERVEYLLRE